MNLSQDKEAKIIDLGCSYRPFLNTLAKLEYKNLCGGEIEISVFVSKFCEVEILFFDPVKNITTANNRIYI